MIGHLDFGLVIILLSTFFTFIHSDCFFVSTNPAMVHIGSLANFTIQFRADRIISDLSVFVGGVEAKGWNISSLNLDPTLQSWEYQFPVSHSKGTVYITSPNCSGILLFQYFDYNDFSFERISKPSIRTGSSIAFSFLKRSWLINSYNMILKLDSLDAGNLNSVSYPLVEDYASLNRIYSFTDSLLESLGSLCKMSISFDNVSFLDLNMSILISSAPKLRVGVLLLGSISDIGWNFALYKGILFASTYFSDSVEISTFENVNIYDQNTIVQYASSGDFDALYLTTDVSQDMVSLYTSDFPHVKFVIISLRAIETKNNVSANFNYIWGTLFEARYLAGVTAGLVMSRGGFACYIKAFDNPEVNQGLNAFTLGVRKYNPTARVLSYTINTWSDPFVEQQTAQWFLDDGRCEVLAQHTDHVSSLDIFTSANKFVIGSNSDSKPIIGEHVLASAIFSWGVILEESIESILDSSFNESVPIGGIQQGAVDISPLSGLCNDEIRNAVMQERSQIVDSYTNTYLFCGPIYDSLALLRIPSGQCADNVMYSTMDWHVLGVIDLGIFSVIPPTHNDSQIGIEVIVSAAIIVFFVVICAIFFAVWLISNNSHPLIQYAQPYCLFVTILGSVIGVSSLIPMWFSPSISDQTAYDAGSSLVEMSFPQMDRCCQTIPFLIMTGYCLTLPVLFWKTWRQHSIISISDSSVKRLFMRQSATAVVFYDAFFYALCLVPLVIWQIQEPLSWKITILAYDSFGNPIKSYGTLFFLSLFLFFFFCYFYEYS